MGHIVVREKFEYKSITFLTKISRMHGRFFYIGMAELGRRAWLRPRWSKIHAGSIPVPDTIRVWCSWSTCTVWIREIIGSNPITLINIYRGSSVDRALVFETRCRGFNSLPRCHSQIV